MSDSECIANEITGPKDGPGDDASRYGDGTVDEIEARYNAKIDMLEDIAKGFAASGRYSEAARKSSEADGVAWALFAAKRIIEKHAKREAGTPTSTPSP